MLDAIRPVDEGHVSSGPIRLCVNHVLKQESDIADLIWDCVEQIVMSAGSNGCCRAIDGLESLRVIIGGKETDFV